MIGYDLDGVIISDIVWDGDTSPAGIARLHSIREHLQPIFVPTGEFVIITGRPEADRGVTEAWLSKWNINPIKLHMFEGSLDGWNDMTSAWHKSKWISNYGDRITCFVESEIKQANKISKMCPSVNVVHFATSVIKSLNIQERITHESEAELRNIYDNLFGDGGENKRV